ncbi:hypothetical protein F-VV10_0149 [Faustovirus]|nr:hypothetical protein F-VV10_0149 [Faustovirus]
MDSMTLSFDIKGMVNGKYLIVASAAAVSAVYIAKSAYKLFDKWLDNRNTAPIPTKTPSSVTTATIIEDYKVNV